MKLQFMDTNQTEIVLLKDKEWELVQDQPCLVKNFTILQGSVNDDGTVTKTGTLEPYAAITIEYNKYGEVITGLITHKIDFMNLWSAFRKRSVNSDEEVILFWSKKHYINKVFKVLSPFFPKMWVLICKKGTYNTWANVWDDLQKERGIIKLSGARSILLPIIEWKPEVME